MRPCLKNEEQRRDYRQASSEQVSIFKTSERLGQAASDHQSDTDTHVPAGQIGGVAVPR